MATSRVLGALRCGPSAGLLLCALTAAPTFSRAATGDCDRECLRGFVTQYLNALISHNPGALPAAAKLKFTENGVQMQLGEGLWEKASGLRKFRWDILDVRQGVGASQVVVEEEGAPVLLQLRLKIDDRAITEIETMVVRNQKEGVLFAPDALPAASEAMTVEPERSQLLSRREAMRIAELYPAGLRIGDFVAVDAPFAANAYRIENGVVTAGSGCTRRPGCENMKAQTIIKHPGLTHRVAAVDEELGIVLLRMNFGETPSYPPGMALLVWEAFKVYAGQIHAVEAFMMFGQASADSGWD